MKKKKTTPFMTFLSSVNLLLISFQIVPLYSRKFWAKKNSIEILYLFPSHFRSRKKMTVKKGQILKKVILCVEIHFFRVKWTLINVFIFLKITLKLCSFEKESLLVSIRYFFYSDLVLLQKNYRRKKIQ